MTITDYESIVSQITLALNTEVEFTQRFTLNGVEFGFIPNLDEMSAGEYIDLTSTGVSADNLHKIMGILFRPIVKEDRHGHYKIEKYKADNKYNEVMKQAPMNIVNGMLVFFCHLSRELKTYIMKSTEEVVEEARRVQQVISQSGDGTQH